MSAMQCCEFRDIADSFPSDELMRIINHNMLEHLESCAACQRELVVGRNLRERLRAACRNAPDARVRPEFVERLRALLQAAASQSAFRERRTL
ncbi:MAG: hypothetical protein H0V88_09215 [Pyrinomonadaceae bacterium]|nr:hypothetical protein [Pyrinomonadaceae bacterium]